MMPSISRRLALSTAVLAAAFAPAVASAADVNIYTSRQPELIQPLLDAFTEESGLTIYVVLEEGVTLDGTNAVVVQVEEAVAELADVEISTTSVQETQGTVDVTLVDRAAFPDRMTIDDAPHISAEDREQIVSAYLPHERDARTLGLPMLGEGRVFALAEDLIREIAFKLPEHWPRLVGCDFGFDHPAAAVWLAWDRDADRVYVTDAQKSSGLTVSVHAAMLRSTGPDIPVSWPHDGLQHDKPSPDRPSVT